MKPRPRAEHCRRLALADLRPLVEPPAAAIALGDGTELGLRWGPARGCYGGRPGRALLLLCPSCGRACRVLWSPPAAPWACGLCHRISYRSHRRPGAHKGCRKPLRWHREAIHAEQRRCAELLGLARFPPDRLIWGLRDLLAAPLRPDAPRQHWRRRLALLQRLNALESLRVLSHFPAVDALARVVGMPELGEPEGLREGAEAVVHRTGWAVRRGPRDPRTTRGGRSPAAAGIAPGSGIPCAERDLADSGPGAGMNPPPGLAFSQH